MRWKSFEYSAANRDEVHVMPDMTVPWHEMRDCWCHPIEEAVSRADGRGSVLMTHNHD